MIIILPDLEGGGNVGNFEPLTGTYQNEQIWTPNQQVNFSKLPYLDFPPPDAFVVRE